MVGKTEGFAELVPGGLCKWDWSEGSGFPSGEMFGVVEENFFRNLSP